MKNASETGGENYMSPSACCLNHSQILMVYLCNVIFDQNNVCVFLFKCYDQFSLMEWVRGYNTY